MPPRRACDLCYKRKIQCLVTTPGEPCDWCRSQDLTCTFDRITHKDPNKRTTSDVVQELSSRVEQLEDALKAARSPPGSTPPRSGRPPSLARASSVLSHDGTPPSIAGGEQSSRNLLNLPINSASVHATPPEHYHRLSRCQLGNNWYFKGVGILSSRGRDWISRGSGQRVFLEKFEIFGNPISTRTHFNPPISAHSRILPPELTCRFLIDVFLKSKTSIVFPILDKDLIEQTIARVYGNEPHDPASQMSAEACLWAMLALLGPVEEVQQSDLNVGPHECALEAEHLLFSIRGFTSLDSLQATLLLWAYQKMKGQCRDASVTFSNACRMVCDLGGHFLLSRFTLLPQHIPTFDQPSRFHVRRLFWLCYCFDKDTSLRTGSPPLLTYDRCEVSDPAEWHNQSRDINLARIKENASRLLYSPRAFQYTEGELLSHARQLDDELEEWRLSIEPPYRPRLSVPPESSLSVPSSMRAEDRTQMINLQLDYLFTMISIHTTVRRCGDFERNLPDDLHSVVHSSADLSLEASRSIFRFMDSVVDFWKENSVWVVSHYAPVAAMPLFINILIHPLGSPADTDLQILSSAGNLARKVPTEGLAVEEIEQVQGIGEFVMELVRLCHSAAWIAKKGEREIDLDIIHP